MNVAIYFDSSKNLGGVHSQNTKLIEIFKKNFSKDYNFTYIVTNFEQKKFFEKRNEKAVVLKKNIKFRIELFLFRFPLFKDLYKKLSINNIFENFLIKNNFDLVFLIHR